MAWFNFLKEQGYFAAEKNPEPILVKNGYQVPYWEILSYLEKTSLQIKEGKELQLASELVKIIEDVSKHPKDNFRTWYMFIKILSNIPNEKIPIDLLDYIPVWLSGKFDTMLQTSELCGMLLPKFLDDNPTKDDIAKAERILHYLFFIEKTENSEDSIENEKENSYHSRLYLHFLADKFEKKGIIPKIVKHCSTDFIQELGRTIKFLLLDYAKGINAIVKGDDKEHKIKILIERENLRVCLIGHSEDKALAIIENWENKSAFDLEQELVSTLKQHDIYYTPIDDADDLFQRLNFALNTDLTSVFGFDSIRELNDLYSSGEKLQNVFASIFRDLLDEKAKQNPEHAIALLRLFCFDNKYRIPFFRRVALYVICENWDVTKSLFWELVKDDDALHIFSIYKYHKELYDLLNKNQQALLQEEKDILQRIINQGEHSEEEKEKEQQDYWALRWYAALKNIEPFKEKYMSLSKSLNMTNKDYERQGKVTIRSGSVSPISMDALLQMKNIEIAEYIRNFNPKDRWEDPNISGLSDTFGKAVEAHPDKFANEIDIYKNIAYIYLYRMFNGFGEAWKKQKPFNCEKVLQYCLLLIKSDEFNSGQLKSENDTWNASADWVLGSIATLLTDGMQSDANAFHLDTLPLAKEIILILVGNLKRPDSEKVDINYPTYSLNSLAGKSLRALLDYSLIKARNCTHEKKWEYEIRTLFESTLKKGIIDGHILEGMYFSQFYYLDSTWIIEQVKEHYVSEEREWLAFIGGLTSGKPPFNIELYNLFYPLYERVIDNNVKLKSLYDNGLVRHITAFYFWKYETLSSEKLLFKFLNQSSPAIIGDLISFISYQEDYQKDMPEYELHEFQQIILELWRYLVSKYENSQIEEEQKNIAALVNWLVFAPKLNEVYTQLIVKSCKHIDRFYVTHQLLEKLIEFKNRNNPSEAARYIGEIISAINFKEDIPDFDKDSIRELIAFMYVHGQKQVANEFCNRMAAVHQLFFLRDIYEANAK